MGRLMAANLEAAGFAVQSFDSNGRGNRKSARAAAENLIAYFKGKTPPPNCVNNDSA